MTSSRAEYGMHPGCSFSSMSCWTWPNLTVDERHYENGASISAALVRGVVTNFDSSPIRRIHLKGLTEPVAMEARFPSTEEGLIQPAL